MICSLRGAAPFLYGRSRRPAARSFQGRLSRLPFVLPGARCRGVVRARRARRPWARPAFALRAVGVRAAVIVAPGLIGLVLRFLLAGRDRAAGCGGFRAPVRFRFGALACPTPLRRLRGGACSARRRRGDVVQLVVSR